VIVDAIDCGDGDTDSRDVFTGILAQRGLEDRVVMALYIHVFEKHFATCDFPRLIEKYHLQEDSLDGVFAFVLKFVVDERDFAAAVVLNRDLT